MRRVLILIFTILYIFSAGLVSTAQTKHPFTFEDMMKLKRVGDPQPSPDGNWVLFSVTDVNLEANTKTPHVWIVPTVGGESREIIFTQSSDRPRWAPDGKRFAFTSTKEGGSQIWVADFDGASGKATATHKLTSIATEADGELWSPDGNNILFVSNVYPECDGGADAEATCNARKLEEHQKSKVKALIFDHLLYRHWNAYKEGTRSHLFVLSVEGGTPRDLTPGDYDAPVFSLGGQDNYVFSPDGQEVAYVSNHDKVEATSTNGDIFLVSVHGGPAKNITADNPAGDFTPLYSPDGKYIAYRSQQRPGYESDRFRLMLYDRKTGEKKNLTEDFDRWVGTIAWAPRSQAIFFTSDDKGEVPIYFTDINGHPVRQIVRGVNDELMPLRDDRTLVFSRMSLQGPSEIYSFDTAKVVQLDRPLPKADSAQDRSTNDNSGDQKFPYHDDAVELSKINLPILSQVSMSPLESFWFEGAKGDKVQGFLVKPPNFDPNKKYPVKFLVHGGPQGAWGDDWSYRWNPELFAANGYVVVMINFHGSTGYGQKFIDEINGNWGGAPFADLMKGLDYAEKTYPFIDKDRECALGASYGGYMTNWILGHTDRFKCIVTHDGMFNSTSAWGTTEELWFNEWEFKGTPYTNREMYDKWSPHMAAKDFKTPTLVVHGQLDYRLDVSEGFQLFTTLQRLGVPSKMLYFPDEGHWVLKPQNSQLWYKTVNDWVDQWTKPGR
jgi:dipeptidyl aminopeptidase/acylaminoacyl peptidase